MSEAKKKKRRLFVFLFKAVTPFLFATPTWPRFVLSAALWGFFIFCALRAKNAAENLHCSWVHFVWCVCGLCVCFRDRERQSVWQVNYPVAKLNCHKRSANIVLMHCLLMRIKHTQRTPAKLLLGSQGGGTNCKTDNFRNYKTQFANCYQNNEVCLPVWAAGWRGMVGELNCWLQPSSIIRVI